MTFDCIGTRSALLPAVIVGLIASGAYAHPLGNDSIAHFNILSVHPDRLEVDFILDIAETPSAIIQAEEIDADKNGTDTTSELKTWLASKSAECTSLLQVTINGDPLTLQQIPEKVDPKTGRKRISRMVVKIPGFAGMATYRLLMRYVGRFGKPLVPGPWHTITYTDNTYVQYIGLRRILLDSTPGIEFNDPRPALLDESPEPFLYEQYDPANLPQERSATIQLRMLESVAASASAPANAESLHQTKTDTPANYLASINDPRNDPAQRSRYQQNAERLISLLQGRWGMWMLLTVTSLSFGWGAAHALMPGHAKTVVAAYLISQKGTHWHAMLLAVIVTLTHTALVVILGLILWFYQTSNPTLGPRVQLWLGTIAGLLVAGMGVMLVWRAVTGRIGHHHHERENEHEHEHEHDPDHDHGHVHNHTRDHRSWFKKMFTHSHPHVPHAHYDEHGNGHRHSRDSHSMPRTGDQLSIRMLLVLGITGGIVPCPTATIIMLLGIGANVVAGALYAVGIFSLGLALTLMAVGSLALTSRRVASRIMSDAKREGELSGTGRRLLLQIIPAASGLTVIALGSAITAHYLYYMQTGRALFRWIG